jgi:hypothetical protein
LRGGVGVWVGGEMPKGSPATPGRRRMSEEEKKAKKRADKEKKDLKAAKRAAKEAAEKEERDAKAAAIRQVVKVIVNMKWPSSTLQQRASSLGSVSLVAALSRRRLPVAGSPLLTSGAVSRLRRRGEKGAEGAVCGREEENRLVRSVSSGPRK